VISFRFKSVHVDTVFSQSRTLSSISWNDC